jgi:hypothetical protein
MSKGHKQNAAEHEEAAKNARLLEKVDRTWRAVGQPQQSPLKTKNI